MPPSQLDFPPITDLTFASVLLQRDDLSVVMSIKRGLLEGPAVRGDDQVVPHRAGRIVRSRVADRTAIELEGVVNGIEGVVLTESESYYATALELKALFDPTAAPATLSCVLPNGSTATIAARVVPPLLWDEVVRGHTARLNVAMESVDPDWVITPAGS